MLKKKSNPYAISQDLNIYLIVSVFIYIFVIYILRYAISQDLNNTLNLNIVFKRLD